MEDVIYILKKNRDVSYVLALIFLKVYINHLSFSHGLRFYLAGSHKHVKQNLYYYIKHLRIGVSIFCHGIFLLYPFFPSIRRIIFFLVDRMYVIVSIDPLFLSISFPYILLFP
jgi:hypothetical protein